MWDSTESGEEYLILCLISPPAAAQQRRCERRLLWQHIKKKQKTRWWARDMSSPTQHVTVESCWYFTVYFIELQGFLTSYFLVSDSTHFLYHCNRPLNKSPHVIYFKILYSIISTDFHFIISKDIWCQHFFYLDGFLLILDFLLCLVNRDVVIQCPCNAQAWRNFIFVQEKRFLKEVCSG